MTTEDKFLVGHTRGSGVSDVLERTESKLLDLEIDQVWDLKILLGHDGTILKDSLKSFLRDSCQIVPMGTVLRTDFVFV